MYSTVSIRIGALGYSTVSIRIGPLGYSTVSIRIGPLGVQYCVNKDRGSWCTVLCQ